MQMWDREGFVQRLKAAFGGDIRVANQAAQSLARATILRNPLGFLGLGIHVYVTYWRDLPELRRILPGENGSPPESEVSPFDAQAIRAAFGVDVSHQNLIQTPTRWLHVQFRDWYVFLLASPLLSAIALWLGWWRLRETFPTLALFLLWSCLLLVATCLGAHESMYRYLHPFSFTGLVAVAFIAEILCRRWDRRPRGRGSVVTETGSVPVST
jgi:hypothetical protein